MSERSTDHIFQRWYKSAEDYERQWRKENDRYFSYVDGDQWTAEERADIISRNQQPTVINMILPTIDMLISNQVNQRSDIQVCGREQSDDDKATLLTALLKHVFDSVNYTYYETQAFRDSITGGRGWMECGIRNNEIGKDIITINHIPWENVKCDPFSRKPDATDARFIIKEKWVDIDVAKKLFPAAAENITTVFGDAYRGQEDEAQKYSGERSPMYRYYDKGSSRVKICECYYKMPEERTVKILNEKTGKEEEKTIAEEVVHYVVFTDEIILEGSADVMNLKANPSPLKVNYYPLIPIYAMRDKKGRPQGVVKSLIDIQDQINKLNSKFIWSLASNRLIAEEGALRDPDEARDEYQKPDGLVVLNEGGINKVKTDDKYRDLSFMANHIQFLLATQQRISGVNDSMLGLGGTNERSGIMQATRINQGAAMQTSILENLYFSKLQVALVVLRLIGTYYTDYRIIRITQPNGAEASYEFNIPSQDAEGNSVILNNIDDTIHYDVVMKKVPPFTTMRERQLQIFSEVAKSGVIPPPIAAKMMLYLSEIPEKENLIFEIEQFYQAQAQVAAPAGQIAAPAGQVAPPMPQ